MDNNQAIIPGFTRWTEDERRYVATLERDQAQAALNSSLQPQRPRRTDDLPLFDPQPRNLFTEER